MKSKNSELVELEGMTGILGWGSAKFCASCKLKMVSTFLKGCFLKEKKRRKNTAETTCRLQRLYSFYLAFYRKIFRTLFPRGTKSKKLLGLRMKM